MKLRHFSNQLKFAYDQLLALLQELRVVFESESQVGRLRVFKFNLNIPSLLGHPFVLGLGNGLQASYLLYFVSFVSLFYLLDPVLFFQAIIHHQVGQIH